MFVKSGSLIFAGRLEEEKKPFHIDLVKYLWIPKVEVSKYVTGQYVCQNSDPETFDRFFQTATHLCPPGHFSFHCKLILVVCVKHLKTFFF